MVQSILMAQEPKKQRNKAVKNKATSKQGKTKPNQESKDEHAQKRKMKNDYDKPKDTRDIAIEEKKIDLNFKPSTINNKTNSFKSKQTSDYEEVKEVKQSYTRSKEKVDMDIPYETVSSFYQIDSNVDQPKFDKYNSYPYDNYHSK